jgi:hypothetical protein
MATITTANLIKDAGEKISQRKQLIEEIAALREILRNLDKAGQLSEQESAWVAEAFPPRERAAAENGDGGE